MWRIGFSRIIVWILRFRQAGPSGSCQLSWPTLLGLCSLQNCFCLIVHRGRTPPCREEPHGKHANTLAGCCKVLLTPQGPFRSTPQTNLSQSQERLCFLLSSYGQCPTSDLILCFESRAVQRHTGSSFESWLELLGCRCSWLSFPVAAERGGRDRELCPELACLHPLPPLLLLAVWSQAGHVTPCASVSPSTSGDNNQIFLTKRLGRWRVIPCEMVHRKDYVNGAVDDDCVGLYVSVFYLFLSL